MPVGQELVQQRRRLGAVALDGAVGGDGLGRVDADEADALDAAARHPHVEGVAVDDRDDDAPVGRAAARWRAAPAGTERQAADDEQREGARHEGLPWWWFRRLAPGGARRRCRRELRGAG